jgi:hypothetical protein
MIAQDIIIAQEAGAILGQPNNKGTVVYRCTGNSFAIIVLVIRGRKGRYNSTRANDNFKRQCERKPDPIPTEDFSEISIRIRTCDTSFGYRNRSVSDQRKCNMEPNANL